MDNADLIDGQPEAQYFQKDNKNFLFRDGGGDFRVERNGDVLTFINTESGAPYLVVTKRVTPPKEGDLRVDHIEESEFVLEFPGNAQNNERFRLTAIEQEEVFKKGVKPVGTTILQTVWESGLYKLEKKKPDGTFENVSNKVIPTYKFSDTEKTSLRDGNILPRATARLTPIQNSLNFNNPEGGRLIKSLSSVINTVAGSVYIPTTR